MKKLLLLALTIASPHIFSMEKEEPTFPWEQLLPELKNEILKEVVNAPSISQAVKYLQSIRFVNKELYAQLTNNKAVLFDILNTILKKFPSSEVAIARALNTNLAEEWLTKINPNVSFKVSPYNRDQANLAEEYLKKGNLAALKEMLNKGYNPRQQTYNGLHLDKYTVEFAMSLPALKLLAQYDPYILSQKNIWTLLWLANKNKEITAPVLSENNEQLISYLEQQLEQQLGEQEAEETIKDIIKRVKRMLENNHLSMKPEDF